MLSSLRTVCAIAIHLVIGATAITAFALPVEAEPRSEEVQFFALTNELRASEGLVPLVVDTQMTYVARAWAGTMAQQGSVGHNPDLHSQVTNYSLLAENVASGPTVAAIEAALEADPGQRANLMNPAFRYVGVGAADSQSQIWVAVDFKTPSSAVAVPPVAGVVPPAPNPAPAPGAPPTVVPSDPAPAPIDGDSVRVVDGILTDAATRAVAGLTRVKVLVSDAPPPTPVRRHPRSRPLATAQVSNLATTLRMAGAVFAFAALFSCALVATRRRRLSYRVAG